MLENKTGALFISSMKRFILTSFAIVLIVFPLFAFSAQKDANKYAYARFIRSIRYIDNYKESAAAMASKIGNSAKGSDEQFAKLMRVVAVSDISDISPCLGNVYAHHNLTEDEANELSEIFESPTGVKLIHASQKTMISDIKRGYPVKPSFEGFTEDDRQQMLTWQQRPSYKKYGQLSTNVEVQKEMFQCILNSRAIKNSGIK
jgi:hypothetical protein